MNLGCCENPLLVDLSVNNTPAIRILMSDGKIISVDPRLLVIMILPHVAKAPALIAIGPVGNDILNQKLRLQVEDKNPAGLKSLPHALHHKNQVIDILQIIHAVADAYDHILRLRQF